MSPTRIWILTAANQFLIRVFNLKISTQRLISGFLPPSGVRIGGGKKKLNSRSEEKSSLTKHERVPPYFQFYRYLFREIRDPRRAVRKPIIKINRLFSGTRFHTWIICTRRFKCPFGIIRCTRNWSRSAQFWSKWRSCKFIGRGKEENVSINPIG